MRTTSQCLALVIAILSSGLFTIAQAQKKTDVTSILNNMFRVYSRLASYQDEGILIMTNDEPTGGTIEKMPFKTFFKRPDRFRFEWTDYGISKLGRTKMIWFNGKEAFTYWEQDSYEKEESLMMAVAGATGVSHGTVNTVSDLLLPKEFGGSTLKRLVKTSLVGEDVFEGVRCYHIKATDDKDAFELWVGKNDFLLRKFRQETKEDGGRLWIEEEIRRKIQVGHTIPEVVFNYKPPIPLTPQKEVDIAGMDKLLDRGPLVWSEFRSEEGQFSILMPDKPTSTAVTIQTPQGRIEEHAFVASHFPLVFTIAYSDIPKQLLAGNNVDALFEGVRDKLIKEFEGKLASESSLSLDGHPGREIRAHVFRGEVRMRLYLVGDRLYQLYLINMEKAFESNDETANKFFVSFKLISITKPIAALPGKYPAISRL